MTRQLPITMTLKPLILPEDDVTTGESPNISNSVQQFLEFSVSNDHGDQAAHSTALERLMGDIQTLLDVDPQKGLQAADMRYDDGLPPEKVAHNQRENISQLSDERVIGADGVTNIMPHIGILVNGGVPSFSLMISAYSEQRAQSAMQHLIAKLKKNIPALADVEVSAEEAQTSEHTRSEDGGTVVNSAQEMGVVDAAICASYDR